MRPFYCADEDLAPDDRCTNFPCGTQSCTIATQYCERRLVDPTGESIYTCKPLPAACNGTASCACLGSEPCGKMCVGKPSLGLVLTCPGA